MGCISFENSIHLDYNLNTFLVGISMQNFHDTDKNGGKNDHQSLLFLCVQPIIVSTKEIDESTI